MHETQYGLELSASLGNAGKIEQSLKENDALFKALTNPMLVEPVPAHQHKHMALLVLSFT